MKTITYRDWVLTVDEEVTATTYNQVSKGSADKCNCTDCQNYVAYRDKAFPNEVLTLFAQLGIDYRKDAEIAHFYGDVNGLHVYSGWFHFKGEFIGQSYIGKKLANGYAIELTPIKDNFSIGFDNENELTFFKDKDGLVQVQFEARIPWVIDADESQ